MLHDRADRLARLQALPHWNEFRSCTAEDIDALETRPIDVDMWTIAMSPEEYARRFTSALAMVQLFPYGSGVSTSRNGKEPQFKEWIMLGLNGYRIWVHPSVKMPFFHALKSSRTIFPSHFQHLATYGNPMVPVIAFVRCLQEAQCFVMWLKTFGQKMTLMDLANMEEPAEVGHPASHHNEWDIGMSYKSDRIWLWSTTAKSESLTVFPIPCSTRPPWATARSA